MPDKPKFGKTGTEFDALAQKYTEKGFISTSNNPYASFPGSKMKIHAPGGKQSHVYPNWYPSSSQFPKELESLLPPGLQLQKLKDGSFKILNPYMMTGAAATGAAAIGASQQYRSGGRPGLWANIHAKRERIKKGSGEKMRKPGSKGAPTDEAIKRSQAKFGMSNPYMQQGGMVPVEMENEERVYMKDPHTGHYYKYMETPENAPTHEEGGVKTVLPEGSYVFPKQYFGMIDEAMAHGGMTGDFSKMDQVKELMKRNARKAYLEGKPYSSGGA